MAVDALGNPLRVILSAGQVADIESAAKTIEHLSAQAVIADKGYDADPRSGPPPDQADLHQEILGAR